MVFADTVQRYVAPARGRRALRAVLDGLAHVEGRLVESDYPAAFRYLAAHNRKRALTVLFTDVIDRTASEALVAHAATLRPRHLPLAVTLRDPALEAPGRRAAGHRGRRGLRAGGGGGAARRARGGPGRDARSRHHGAGRAAVGRRGGGGHPVPPAQAARAALSGVSQATASAGRTVIEKDEHRRAFHAVREGHRPGRRAIPSTFGLAVLVILAWAVTGPHLRFSDTWQLVINTGTTIVTFLMVFLIQNTQNRDSVAMQVKLDELLRALKGAQTAMADLEDLTEAELDAFKAHYAELAAAARSKMRREGGLPFGRKRRAQARSERATGRERPEPD